MLRSWLPIGYLRCHTTSNQRLFSLLPHWNFLDVPTSVQNLRVNILLSERLVCLTNLGSGFGSLECYEIIPEGLLVLELMQSPALGLSAHNLYSVRT